LIDVIFAALPPLPPPAAAALPPMIFHAAMRGAQARCC